MGILDDAIREHLELKRKHGARDAELQQLEDEAFGPPSRPGEPDFPERPPTGEEQVVEPLEEGAPAEPTRILAPEREEPAVPTPPPEAEEGVAGEPGAEPERADAVFYDRGEPEEGPTPAPAEEAEAAEHRILDAAGPDTVEHPAPEPSAETGEEDELVVGEIELELDEEFEEFREVDGPEGAESSAAETGEQPPIDEPDEYAPIGETEEHAAIGETGEPAPTVEDEDEEGFTDERDAILQTEGERIDEDDDDAEEDVLEETPEFLRDTPEDERLWFEQGEPRDFDFDDD